MGRSVQRHKGGVRRTEDSRGAECPGGQIHLLGMLNTVRPAILSEKLHRRTDIMRG
jgi:hypothetical protein